MILPPETERRYYWRRGMRAQYALNLRVASRSIRYWCRPVRASRVPGPWAPVVSVWREPVDRALSAMAAATDTGRCAERTVAEYLQRLRTGDWCDLHLVPQAWWLEGVSELVRMEDGWEVILGDLLGVDLAGTTIAIGALPAPRCTKKQRKELEGIYAMDYEMLGAL